MDLAQKIEQTVRSSIRAEIDRIINEEVEMAKNRIRRRLADSAGKITSQISCQLIPKEDQYEIRVTLPGTGARIMQGETVWDGD